MGLVVRAPHPMGVYILVNLAYWLLSVLKTSYIFNLHYINSNYFEKIVNNFYENIQKKIGLPK